MSADVISYSGVNRGTSSASIQVSCPGNLARCRPAMTAQRLTKACPCENNECWSGLSHTDIIWPLGHARASWGRFGIRVESGHKGPAGQEAFIGQPLGVLPRAERCLRIRTLASAAGLGVRKRVRHRGQRDRAISIG